MDSSHAYFGGPYARQLQPDGDLEARPAGTLISESSRVVSWREAFPARNTMQELASQGLGDVQ